MQHAYLLVKMSASNHLKLKCKLSSWILDIILHHDNDENIYHNYEQ